jgi:AcrR family transcriptional regulator
MTTSAVPQSARRAELLELAYAYAIRHGRADMSLRPMAAAIGSSPRVLLYLFGSKDGLTRALLARARADELRVLAELRRGDWPAGAGLREAGTRIWAWLADEARRPLLRLWLDGYTRSLTQPDGPWSGFGRDTVEDWLALLAEVQSAGYRDAPAGLAERTLLLAVLRGMLLDLLTTGDVARTTAAVHRHLAAIEGP